MLLLFSSLTIKAKMMISTLFADAIALVNKKNCHVSVNDILSFHLLFTEYLYLSFYVLLIFLSIFYLPYSLKDIITALTIASRPPSPSTHPP